MFGQQSIWATDVTLTVGSFMWFVDQMSGDLLLLLSATGLISSVLRLVSEKLANKQ